MYKAIVSLLVFLSLSLSAQDSTVSSVIKGKSSWLPRPKIKILPKQYSLLAGFALVKEANSGDLFAQHELGLRYLNGWGFESDTAKAIYWINKAAESNLIAAKYNLAIMYYNGIGVNWDPFIAYSNFKYTANKGYPGGQLALGLYYLNNFVVNRDTDTAYKWIKFAADAENERAKEIVEAIIEGGYSPPDTLSNKESPTSSQRFEEDMQQTNWDVDMFSIDENMDPDSAETKIANLLAAPRERLQEVLKLNKIRDSLAIKDSSNLGLVRFAAKTDSPEALLILGKAHELGDMAEQDVVKALQYYIRAYRFGSRSASGFIVSLLKKQDLRPYLDKEIKKDNADAMFVRAGLVAIGLDYSLFPIDALELLEKAVDLNHTESMIELGMCYYTGNLVDEDKNKAIDLWAEAANRGSLEADIRISFANIQSGKSKEELVTDIGILSDAANKGAVLAETVLAFCYENGIYFKADKGKAASLYWTAMGKGNYAAYLSLKRMHDDIRPEEETFSIFE